MSDEQRTHGTQHPSTQSTPQCSQAINHYPMPPLMFQGVTKEDLHEIKLELKEIGVTLRQLAVQDERIQANRRDIDQAKVDIQDLYVRINNLRSDHDKCEVNKLGSDMVWFKWLTGLIIAALVGISFSLIGDHFKHQSGGGAHDKGIIIQKHWQWLQDGGVLRVVSVPCDDCILRDDTDHHGAGRYDHADGGRGGPGLSDRGRPVDSIRVRRDLRDTGGDGRAIPLQLCSVPTHIREGLMYSGRGKVRPAKLSGTQERGERAGNGGGVLGPGEDHPQIDGDLPGADNGIEQRDIKR